MRVTDLFFAKREMELSKWISGFDDPIDLLNAVPGLFESLKETSIEGEVHEHVAISGNVKIGKGSVIHSNVVLDGPIIIGENVSIRSHAQIRKGVYIGSRAVIGHGADVKASLCMDECKIQDGTFVGDSIIGFGTRIGSGAILANRKFSQSEIRIQRRNGDLVGSGRDFLGAIVGDNSRIGANAVLSPGTIIGQHTWVAPGITLLGTYESDQLITVKQEIITKPKKRVYLKHGHLDYEGV
jgi:bifunctional UDP-N-acetylglucosamine pyrophosphorylase/glucosamine-1-phosphate N-acetyltransferase